MVTAVKIAPNLVLILDTGVDYTSKRTGCQLLEPSVVRLIGLAPIERCHQVPLLGRGHQAHVAVSGDALAVENHFHGRILLVYENGVIRAVVEKDTKALSIEVILVGHRHGNIGAEKTWAAGQGQEQTHSNSVEHRF